MCPLKLLPSLVPDPGHELCPEFEMQRAANSSRISEIVRYVTGNAESYVMAVMKSPNSSRDHLSPDGSRSADDQTRAFERQIEMPVSLCLMACS